MSLVKKAGRLCALASIAAAALAQPTVAPTPTGVAPNEQTIGGYTVSQSFELGLRARQVDGNAARYRSDINYRPGLRLLGSTLNVHSLEGHGGLFDELTLTTQGLGGDPYQSAILRLRHNRFYRYDLNWRLNDYENPGLQITTAGFSAGAHSMNTRRLWQDHDITLLPTLPLQFLFGVTRNTQTGPALSSIQLFNATGDEFPLFSNIHRAQTEYRAGMQLNFQKFRFLFLHGWQSYNEDGGTSVATPQAGNNTADRYVLNNYNRTEPYTGKSPFWRGNLSYEASKFLAVNARFDYTGGRRDFRIDESVMGLDRIGAARNRQTLIAGTGTRPVSSGALTISIFPADKVTLTNQTAFHQIQMNGNAAIAETTNGVAGANLVDFQYLGIRTVVNNTDLNVQANRWLGLFGGFSYSHRRIRSTVSEAFTGGADAASAQQTNRLKAGTFGFRIRAFQGFTATADVEVGRAVQPFLPVSDRNYTATGARIQYRRSSLTLSAFSRAAFNTNTADLTRFSSTTNNSGISGNWTPSERFSLDAGYSKLHVHTLGGLNYFVAGNLTPGFSRYVSNIHSTHTMVRFAPHARVDLFAGFTRVQDTGDGRSYNVTAQVVAAPIDPSILAQSAFAFYQVWPLSFTSPQARVSLHLRPKLTWNVGYQYYNYDEKATGAAAPYDYRAHTGYTSLLWSF